MVSKLTYYFRIINSRPNKGIKPTPEARVSGQESRAADTIQLSGARTSPSGRKAPGLRGWRRLRKKRKGST